MTFFIFGYLVVISAILYIGRTIFSGISSYYFAKVSQEVLSSLKSDLFRKVLKLPFRFYDEAQTGYILARIGEVENE
uniref:ABC transporter ATP-binding protein n=1 Tax=Dictyoglomus thermophilum TaxID=14 RepID=A0A7C3RLU1_DICTH